MDQRQHHNEKKQTRPLNRECESSGRPDLLVRLLSRLNNDSNDKCLVRINGNHLVRSRTWQTYVGEIMYIFK